jgi:predicted ester cyclase
LAIGLVGPVAGGLATPDAVAEEATAAEVPQLVAELAAAWNAHDPQRVAALHTADAIVELGYSGEVISRGRDQIAKEFVGGVLATYPDVRFETRGGYISDDLMVWRWTFNAHYTGQEPGLPPGTGQPVSFGGVSLYELLDGLISRKIFYTDDLAFMEQLDLLCPESAE